MARYDPRHPMTYENRSQDSQRGWNDDDERMHREARGEPRHYRDTGYRYDEVHRERDEYEQSQYPRRERMTHYGDQRVAQGGYGREDYERHDVHYDRERSIRNDYEDRAPHHRGTQYAAPHEQDDKDYARRYGRNPEERASHRYEDANAPYAQGNGRGERTIYVTEDYDDDYLNRRLRSGR